MWVEVAIGVDCELDDEDMIRFFGPVVSVSIVGGVVA